MEKVTDFRRLLSESLSRKIIDQIVISVSRRPQEFIPLIPVFYTHLTLQTILLV